ncbi:translation initiation factor [Sphingobacteriales bacterium UPWRP_1]|nr:translation initiation factor [Sphingobacteriales bacterium TSM_CSS]PSJ73931.1 translation initiation factor [Sphingobacteriales bacterium UPWRP_1]
MSNKKNKTRFDGIVYSTNPDFVFNSPDSELPEENPSPDKQNLRVKVERKGRGGKTVTLVTGFIGPNDDLEALAKTLKTKCGVGGSAKEGEIVLQGDFKQKVAETLKTIGYTKTKTV